jgi:xanthosine utilization system XapX-like protein
LQLQLQVALLGLLSGLDMFKMSLSNCVFTVCWSAEHLVLRLMPKKKNKGKVRLHMLSLLRPCQLPACTLHAFIMFLGVLQGVRWAEDVVDNELMNKKKSKSECLPVVSGSYGAAHALSANQHLLCHHFLPCAECCIFHKQRQFGEWSDDEDSDTECSCDNESGQQQQHREPT